MKPVDALSGSEIFIQERTCEETFDVPVLHVMEETRETVKHVPQERAQKRIQQGRIAERIAERLVDVLVPQIRAHSVEIVKVILQEHLQQNTGEQAVDVPVASIQEETGRMTQLIPQKRLSDHVVEQTVDVPGPQIHEQNFEGAKTIPQECLQSEVAPIARSSRSYGLTAELHVGQIKDLQNTVKAMNALHDVAQKDLSILEQASRNDFSKFDAGCNACDAHNLVKHIGALEADMEKTHCDSLTHETRLTAVEAACQNDLEDLDRALQNVARETENNRQVVNTTVSANEGDFRPHDKKQVTDIPVIMQRQVPAIQEVQKTVSNPAGSKAHVTWTTAAVTLGDGTIYV